MKQRKVIELPARVPDKESKPMRQLRVAAYCRVSTNSEAQQTSYQTQKDYYTEKINSNPDWTLAGIFADHGITGTSVEKRPGFQKMIGYCKKGKIDLILTKSISRFARNTLDCIHYVRLLLKLGIPVIFENEMLDTSKMDGEFMLALLGANSQAESEATSARVKWGVRAGFKEGRVRYYYKHWLGYRKGPDGEPEIVPEEAEIVRYIFSSYLNGASVRKIKEMLENEQIVTKDGRPSWTVSGLQNLLKNEKYTGDVLLQKTFTTDPISGKRKKNNGELSQYLVQDCHDAIISHEMFDMVQAETQRRANALNKALAKQRNAPVETYSGKYALSGILTCGECGTLYRRCTWKKKDTTRIVWRCRNRIENGKKYCGHSPSIDEMALHRAIVLAMNTQLYQPEYLLAPFDQNLRDASQDRPIIPGKNGKEVYTNILEVQRRLDMEFVELLTQCGEKKAFEGEQQKFQELIQRREKFDNMSKTLKLDQYKEEHQQTDFCLPHQFTQYNDAIVRQLLSKVKVIDKHHLLVVFKGGAEVEQIIE